MGLNCLAISGSDTINIRGANPRVGQCKEAKHTSPNNEQNILTRGSGKSAELLVYILSTLDLGWKVQVWCINTGCYMQEKHALHW